MKILAFVLICLAVITGWFAFDLYRDAGELKAIHPHFSGAIHKITGVVGAEDITVDARTGLAYLSCDDRRAGQRGEAYAGALFVYDFRGGESQPQNATPKLGWPFHPHGLSLYVAKDGGARLFVVNHRDAETHTIEIFSVRADTLRHLESIADPLMHSPNDVFAVGPRQFYVTNDHGNTSALGKTLEDYLRLPRSYVLYFDGVRCRKVAEGLRYANGVNGSPDGRKVYVAAVTEGRIRVYDRDVVRGDLTPTGDIQLGTGADNIEVDAGHTLWVGAHPKLLTFVRHARDARQRSPSQIVRITPDPAGGYAVEEVFLDDGSRISAATVAAPFGRRLLVGSVFEPHILLLELAP